MNTDEKKQLAIRILGEALRDMARQGGFEPPELDIREPPDGAMTVRASFRR